MSSSTNKKDLWYSATTLKNGIRAAHEAGAYANELKRRNVKWSPWRGGTSEKWGVVREGFLRGRGRIEGGERGNNGLLGGVGGGAGRARTFAEGMMERGERGEVWEPDDELSTIIPPRRRITAPPTVNEPQRLMIEPGTVQMPPPPMYNPREYAVNPQETRQNVQKKQVYQAQDYGGSGVEERYGGKGMEDRYIGTSGGVRKLPPSKEVRMWLDSQNAKPKEYQGTRRKERSRGRSRGRRRSRVGYRS